MQLTEEQFSQIRNVLPKPRGNLKLGHRHVVNGILYVMEQGCKWRSLPPRYGPWPTVYMRRNRWAKEGVLLELFQA